MLAQLIHSFFDGTLSDAQSTALLQQVRGEREVSEEFQRQQTVHNAIEADKAGLIANSRAEDDLEAIFAKVQPQKKATIPLPILPFADAHAPETALPTASNETPRQAGFSVNLAADKPAIPQRKSRRIMPFIGRVALQAISFCVVGAVAATFGVAPLGKQSFRVGTNETLSQSHTHSSTFIDAGTTTKEITRQQDHFRATSGNGANGEVNLSSGMFGAMQPLIAFSQQETDIVIPIGVEKNERTIATEVVSGYDGELVQDCPIKGAKRPSWFLDEPTQSYATQLEVTKIPRTKAVKPLKQAFEQSLALTARVSRNIFPNGFAGSVGAVFSVSERDAVGLEIGGAFERPGFKSGNQERVEVLTPAGFVAGMYRFMMPVENTRFAGFSQIRFGVETTGAVFAGIGLGVQYGLTDKITVFASTEASRTLIPAFSGDSPFNAAHDGVSLGVAIKL